MKYFFIILLSFSAFADEYTIKCASEIDDVKSDFELKMQDSREGGEFGTTTLGDSGVLLKMNSAGTELIIQRGDSIFSKTLKGTPKSIKYEAGFISKHIFNVKGNFKVTCFPQDKFNFKKTGNSVVKPDVNKAPGTVTLKNEFDCNSGWEGLNTLLEQNDYYGCYEVTGSKNFQQVLQNGQQISHKNFFKGGVFQIGNSEFNVGAVTSVGDGIFKSNKGVFGVSDVYGNKMISFITSTPRVSIKCFDKEFQKQCTKPKSHPTEVNDSERSAVKDVAPNSKTTPSSESSAVQQ